MCSTLGRPLRAPEFLFFGTHLGPVPKFCATRARSCVATARVCGWGHSEQGLGCRVQGQGVESRGQGPWPLGAPGFLCRSGVFRVPTEFLYDRVLVTGTECIPPIEGADLRPLGAPRPPRLTAAPCTTHQQFSLSPYLPDTDPVAPTKNKPN